MTSVSVKNKIRGRAFQTKLAEMAGGMNVGTLGGEDVMHDEFSYEAKTYNKKAKSYGNKDWVGEKLIRRHFWFHENETSKFLSLVLESPNFASIVLLRWETWAGLLQGKYEKHDSVSFHDTVKKFSGNTYMKQAESNCPDGKLPVVVVHTTGMRHKKDIVMIRRLYWESLLEKLFDK